MGKHFSKSVIPRLDRGIQTIKELDCPVKPDNDNHYVILMCTNPPIQSEDRHFCLRPIPFSPLC